MAQRPGKRALAGYSLIELLVVMVIAAGLLTLGMSVIPTLDSFQLTRAGQTVADQIGLARQIASSRNRSVEVRLIARDSNVAGYGAVQLWLAAQPQSAAKPLGRVESLPQGTVISKDASLLSRLLQNTTAGTMQGAAGMGNAPYASFSISPSGLVCSGSQIIPNNGDAYLTVLSTRFANAATAPANFATVQINPLTGAPRIYRP